MHRNDVKSFCKDGWKIIMRRIDWHGCALTSRSPSFADRLATAITANRKGEVQTQAKNRHALVLRLSSTLAGRTADTRWFVRDGHGGFDLVSMLSAGA